MRNRREPERTVEELAERVRTALFAAIEGLRVSDSIDCPPGPFEPSIMLTLQKGDQEQLLYFEDGETAYWKYGDYFDEVNLATDRSVDGLIETIRKDFQEPRASRSIFDRFWRH